MRLSTADLSFAYRRGARVVDGVSLSIAGGAIVGLIGPNGSGKTTLVRLLNGTLTPAAGTVALDSVLRGRYAHLGAFALEGPADVSIARAALAATGTAALEARQFATLSGGEKQRVVIASALAQSSDVLLLDEPTTALDIGFQHEIASLLSKLNRERGTTMVISTHDLNLAAMLCTELVLMKSGRVLAQGPTREVLTANNIRRLYGIDADVADHPRAGHLTVVPLARAE